MGCARAAAASGVKLLLAWQLARTGLRIGFSAATAILVGRLVMGTDVPAWLLMTLPALLAAAALAGLMSDRVQMRTETAVAADLRQQAGERLRQMSARAIQTIPTGTLTISMQRHPPAVASLVTGHSAATLMMAIGPLAAASALFWVSWQAVLLMLALTPVMIVFFALVGETIRARAVEQERAFSHLAGQFADRIRTLPTILANHGLAAEEAKLADRLQAYAANTMGVLGVAFLNAGIIDFFASLSIAMLAVFLGLGHLKLAMIPGFSNLELWQSLFVLMIAPDYFAPFRRFSEQYHAKAEGLAAAAALDGLLNADTPDLPRLPAVDRAMAGMELPARGLVAIVGPSGSGKSTLLRRLACIEAGGSHDALQGRKLCWISGDCYVPGGSLADAIAFNNDAACLAMLRDAAGKVGLLDDAMLPGEMDAMLAAGGANLSGGQRLRISIARAMLGDDVIIADEPTAKLDRRTAEKICNVLGELARTRLVLVATHDRDLVALADRTFALSATPAAEAA
jgi:ATP-binding cassette subfamily C protein